MLPISVVGPNHMLMWKLHTTCRRQSDFDPATLFGDADDGFYLNASNLTSQLAFGASETSNIVGMTPPVSVSRISDLGPRGHVAHVHGTLDHTPVYNKRQSYGKTLHFWQFDGNRDRYYIDTSLTSGKYDIVVALSKVPDYQGNWQNSGWRGIFSHTGDTCSLFLRGSGPSYGTWGPGYYGAETTLADTELPVVISMVGGASGSFRLNGVHDGTYGSTTGQSSNRPFIGGDFVHNQSSAMRLYAILVINRRLTDNELSSVETLFADLSGITLG